MIHLEIRIIYYHPLAKLVGCKNEIESLKASNEI